MPSDPANSDNWSLLNHITATDATVLSIVMSSTFLYFNTFVLYSVTCVPLNPLSAANYSTNIYGARTVWQTLGEVPGQTREQDALGAYSLREHHSCLLE